MALSIDIAANTRQAASQVKDFGKTLDAVGDSLDDLAKDATKAGSDVERGLDDVGDAGKDAAKDIDSAGDKMERTFKELVDDAKKADKAVEGIGDSGKAGFSKAAEGASEFKDEANSTAKEAAASFDGSAESIGDAFQEVAANAFSGFGPVGAAAGIAAAAGIGLAIAGFEATEEAKEKSEESIQEWADKFVEAGGRIQSEAQIVGAVIDIATGERFTEAAQNAKDWGVDVGTAMRAMAGDASALSIVQEVLADRTEESNRQSAEQERQTTDAAGAVIDLADSVNRGKDSFDKLNSEMGEGAQRASAVSDAMFGLIDSAADASIQVDELGNQVVTLPDNTQIFIDAKTGQASQNIDGFKGKLNEVPSNKAVTVNGTVSLDDSKIRNYRPPTVNVPTRGIDRQGKTVW